LNNPKATLTKITAALLNIRLNKANSPAKIPEIMRKACGGQCIDKMRTQKRYDTGYCDYPSNHTGFFQAAC
jgi:hypothetical protein